MASIDPNGRGGWEIRWYAADGKRRSKTVYGSLKQAQLRAAQLEEAEHKRPGTTPLTVGEAIAEWLAWGADRRSPTTNRAIEVRTKNWTQPRIGHLLVTKVTHRDVESFLNGLRPHLSHDSIDNIRWDLSGAFRLAQRDGLIERNPVDFVRFDRRDEDVVPEITPPSIDDLNKLLAVVDARTDRHGAELALAVRLALVTGCRRGEVCGLRWADFDHDRLTLRIERNVIDGHDSGVVVRRTKTKVRRVAALTPGLSDRVLAHEAAWRGCDGEPDVEHVFRGGLLGQPMSPTALSSRFHKARKAAGVNFRFHDLRHLAVSVWLREMPAHEVSRAIGHKHLATTTGVYGHLVGSDADHRTAEAMAKLFDL